MAWPKPTHSEVVQRLTEPTVGRLRPFATPRLRCWPWRVRGGRGALRGPIYGCVPGCARRVRVASARRCGIRPRRHFGRWTVGNIMPEIAKDPFPAYVPELPGRAPEDFEWIRPVKIPWYRKPEIGRAHV